MTGLQVDVSAALAAAAAEVVPWFEAQLPAAYFHDIPARTQRLHLAALVGAKATGVPPAVTLQSDAGRLVTVIRAEDRPGLLAELLRGLPDDQPLHQAKVYTARDGGLVLDVFSFGEPERFDADAPAMAAKRLATLAWAAEHDPDLSADDVDAYLSRCGAVFVDNLTPRRLVRFARLHRQVAGTDDVAVAAWSHDEGATITLAAGRVHARRLFERVAALLGHHGLSVVRAYLDPLSPGQDAVTLCTFVVQSTHPGGFVPDGPAWEALRRDLHRLKWLDDRVIACAYDHPQLGLARAEVIVALLDLVHVRLARRDPFGFSRDRLAQLAAQAIDVVSDLADDLLTGSATGRARLDTARLTEDTRTVLDEVARAIGATRGTNLHREHRYGLVLDLDPELLLGPDHTSVPYGVVYGHGVGFRAFHVRFREIARGGLRVVVPRALDQHALETERLFDEVYGLAFAQQLKNKDIPEGGAKGVILVHPGASAEQAVRAFTDGLLDLATGTPAQLLYLGPDENITPALITWIATRAADRGYAQPLAFMSSKPGAGINHKDYGVTSEGVTVFLETALRAHGVDPHKQPFTVKLTGGPDGDVAGNMIRILHREFGTHARVVGIADGSGSAEDPDGLDHAELLRLFAAALPIASFDTLALGPRGRVLGLDDPGGLEARNTLHSRIVADVFVPAGGRPRTLDGRTWRSFLQADGRPTSPIIVEGANLFLTPDARAQLSARGVSIVKDSSANKCGVICSSFEIAACMVLDEAQFLAVKDVFVQQVLDRLRTLARSEAELLFKARRRWPDVALPELSVRLSHVVLRTTDAIARALIGLDPEAYALLEEEVFAHLPPVLVERLGRGLLDRLPPAYVEQTIACAAATRIVYREGLDFLEGRDDADVAALAVAYLAEDRKVKALADAVARSGMPDAGRVADLLRLGGTRAALWLDEER
ncbi:MAG: hypothetical protein H6733_03260 [Alphaproteobacteria bacterium]|nr:hypothetical protein [Alphaproteobacteria bacterium]